MIMEIIFDLWDRLFDHLQVIAKVALTSFWVWLFWSVVGIGYEVSFQPNYLEVLAIFNVITFIWKFGKEGV